MEQFKKSFSANQQKNRPDIIKNTSRSLSAHDSFGLSQEHTQQDLSNTVKDAEKDLLHEIPKHEKLVGELLKAQSEYHEVCAQEQMAEGFSQERKLALDRYIDICKEKTKQLNERDDIERVAQMPDDPEHKPFRKTSSEKALAQR